MQVFLETLAVLLAGAALFILGWLLVGRLSAPAGSRVPVFAVIPASGDGETMEHDLRGLLWLQGSGLARFTVVIADCGLNETGRAAALLLARREQSVLVCPPERVGALLSNAEHRAEAL